MNELPAPNNLVYVPFTPRRGRVISVPIPLTMVERVRTRRACGAYVSQRWGALLDWYYREGGDPPPIIRAWP